MYPRPSRIRTCVPDANEAIGELAQRLTLRKSPGIGGFHPSIGVRQWLRTLVRPRDGRACRLQVAALRQYFEPGLRQQYL